jgi:hypothetical protein
MTCEAKEPNKDDKQQQQVGQKNSQNGTVS